MNSKIALLMYYTRENRNSFNSLLGALESDDYFDGLNIYLMDNENLLFSNLENMIPKYEKIIICFSFFTTQIWDIYKTIKQIKEHKSKKIICIAGGPHPTGDPKGTLEMGFDIIIRHEGEETLIELLKKIDQDMHYEDVKGISLIDNEGEYCFTGKRKPIELDNFPPFSVKYKKFGPIEITRGCPFGCYFCQTSGIFGGNIRHRSVNVILDYVETMIENNFIDIRFITPNAFSYGSEDGKALNLYKIDELLSGIKEIIPPNGKIFFGSFPSEVRPEHVNSDTINLILKYANNDNLIIGAQSGSQKVLDLCHRGHTVEDVYNAVKMTLDFGLKANVDFIFGLPHETEEDSKISFQFMKKLAKMGAKIHAHTFLPLPQTPFIYEPPGKVDKTVEKEIRLLISKGMIYGDWKKQEKMAHKITEYFKHGIK